NSSGGGGPTATPPTSLSQLTTYVGSASDTFYALNAATGSLRWQHTISGLANKPLESNGIVYVATQNGDVYALNAGGQVWHAQLGVGTIGRPALQGGLLFLADENGSVHALDAAAGTERWHYPTGGYINGTVAASSNGLVYVGSADAYLYALDAGSGTLKWRYNTSSAIEFTSPALGGG